MPLWSLCPDMSEEAGFQPAKRFRQGSGPPNRSGYCSPGRQVVMLPSAGGGGRGGGQRQQPPLAQPSASPYLEAVERQRRSLPIFQARAQLLTQLRNLDSAVLIGKWPRPGSSLLPVSGSARTAFLRFLSPSFICFYEKPDCLFCAKPGERPWKSGTALLWRCLPPVGVTDVLGKDSSSVGKGRGAYFGSLEEWIEPWEETAGELIPKEGHSTPRFESAA